jgi:lipoprotein-anchoring transpeptidase ErfK/SrfK
MTNVLIAAYIFCSIFNSNFFNILPSSNSIRAQFSGSKSITAFYERTYPPIVEKTKPDIDFSKLNFADELKTLGYLKNDTADPDINLRDSVIRFQADHNMSITGVWDEKSKDNLKKQLLSEKYEYNDTVSNPPVNDKWILINKTKRILTLYEEKNVLKKYPVAVGNPPSLTPNGKFNIVVKVVDPTWGGGGYAQPIEGGAPNNPLGHRWMGLTPNGGSSYGVHGNCSPYSIGTYASHGCIRMINHDVEELYSIVPNGIPVWICTEDIMKDWGITQKEYLGGDEK